MRRVLTYSVGLVAGQDVCFASGMAPEKPFPSLTQCYRHNEEACCKSGHDHLVNEALTSVLAPACLKEYPALEDLYCSLCSKDSTYSRSEDTPLKGPHMKLQESTVYIVLCNSFLDSLWGASLDSFTNVFDNCGLQLPENKSDPNSERRVFVPSAVDSSGEPSIPNVDDFLERISAIFPPLVRHNGAAVQVQIVRQGADSVADVEGCLSGCSLFSLSLVGMIVLARV